MAWFGWLVGGRTIPPFETPPSLLGLIGAEESLNLAGHIGGALPSIALQSCLDLTAEAAGLSLPELPALVQTSMLIDEKPCGIRYPLVGRAFPWGGGLQPSWRSLKALSSSLIGPTQGSRRGQRWRALRYVFISPANPE